MAILIISPERWSDHAVSKHHYATELARRGYTVLFLDPPARKTLSLEKIADNLYRVEGDKVARGLRYYPKWLRRKLERRWLEKVEHAIHKRVSTIWLFENSRFFDMNFAGNRLRIYHQVDLNQDFNEEIAASSADICFCTTDFIKDRLISYNPCIYKIHHGVEIPSRIPDLSASQLSLFKRTTVNVAYIGNLEMAYMDTDLLAGLVKKFSHVSFHLVGGYRENGTLRQSCKQYENAIWWGKVDSALIPAICQHADILLVSYRESRYRDQASPHKMMEYFASGKTIVATYTDEYKDKRHLLRMVEKASDFPDAFAEVAENLKHYNSPERQAARIEYARQHGYDRQLDKITALLKKHQLDEKMIRGE